MDNSNRSSSATEFPTVHKDSEKLFDAYKHVTTLASALILLTVSVVTNTKLLESEEYRHLVIAGCILFVAILLASVLLSVEAMFDFADGSDKHKKIGKLGAGAFTLSLTTLLSLAMVGFITGTSIIETRGGLDAAVELPYCEAQQQAILDEYRDFIAFKKRRTEEFMALLRQKETELGCRSVPAELQEEIGGHLPELYSTLPKCEPGSAEYNALIEISDRFEPGEMTDYLIAKKGLDLFCRLPEEDDSEAH